MPGLFITFEGGEGAGKSTQIERLAERLRARIAREIVVTREPGGSPRAERIRDALLAGAAKRHGPFAEALLFAAARLDHLETLIRPALARDAIVICDRFMDSTRAYQGAGEGLPAALVASLERVVVASTRPDVTLILDLAPELGLARAGARERARSRQADRFEEEAADFHARLRAGFQAIARSEPGRCHLVDASQDADRVESAILAVVTARLPELRASRTDAA